MADFCCYILLHLKIPKSKWSCFPLPNKASFRICHQMYSVSKKRSLQRSLIGQSSVSRVCVARQVPAAPPVLQLSSAGRLPGRPANLMAVFSAHLSVDIMADSLNIRTPIPILNAQLRTSCMT